MKTIQVKDIMIPLSEYATASEDASLVEAIEALATAQNEYNKTYKHRAILIYDNSRKIVGKISQWDILRALEPRYSEICDENHQMSRHGFGKQFIKSMFSQFNLADEPFNNVCKRTALLKLKDVMHTPSEGEFVEEGASVSEAIHQLIMGHHQSLLVTKGSDIVGIIKLSDVFLNVCKTIKGE